MPGATPIEHRTPGRTYTLGTVEAGGTERFIIAAPATQTVTVRGAAITGSRTAGPYTVTLVAGTTQQVRLR